jgi:4-diphosphocytidyl-2-C-methyl-D-erythritol kinase
MSAALHALWDVPAPAKLNLFLHVVGRPADGYHQLQSPYVLIDWCDTLHFERPDDGTIARHDLAEPLPPDDLCLRAARLLQAESGTAFGVDISIDKQLPSGAGMGGGSSDAATVLMALNRLWGLNWPRARLLALAPRLGADVPFFVGGRNAFVEGIGERLTPIELPRQWFAVVKPPVAIPTKAIFDSPLLARDTKPVILAGFLADPTRWASDAENTATDGPGFDGQVLRNDLQPAAEHRAPEVKAVARWLDERFGNSRMTGSGSAVFARAGTGDQPVATWPVEALPPGWVGRLCRSLSAHPLVGWAD